MNIIEKFGMRIIEPFSTVDADGNMKYRHNDVLKIQADRFALLNAIIEDTISLEWRKESGAFSLLDQERLNGNIYKIQSTTGKSWEEIKELIE